MRVLLVNPPRTTKVLGMEEDKLGLLYIAALLRSNNIDVRIYDSQIERNSFRELRELLKMYKPHIVGITTSTPTRFDAFQAARLVKHVDKRAFVIAGGPHVSAAASDTLDNIKEIDMIVIGEGEYTFLEVCNQFSKRGNLNDVKGIAFRKEGHILINPRRERISDLDKLPFPSRDLLRRYREKEVSKYCYNVEMPNREIIKMSNASIITARGCPFNCLFCAAPELWGRNIKQRSAENVISEIKHLKETFNVDSFRFCDDTFNISKNRVFDICNLILKEHLKVKWHCHLRADKVDKEMLCIMKEAGCFIISLGVESGSQAILDNVIDKRIDLDKVSELIQWCDDLGIKRSCNFIYSLPGETKEDLNKTLSFMERLGGKQPFGPTIILPGSRIERIAKTKGLLPKDFSWSRISPYKYYDPTSNSFLPIFVDKLTWQEILDIFYKHITHQSTVRTKNYIYRIMQRLFHVRSFVELRLIFWNYFNLLKIFFTNIIERVRGFFEKEDTLFNRASDRSIYSAFAKNIFFYFGSSLIANLALFAINVMLARLLGSSDYAIIVLLMSVVGIFVVFSNLGVSDAATKFIAEHEDGKERGFFISSSFGLFLPIAILASLGLFLSSGFISRYIFNGNFVFYLQLASFWVLSYSFILFMRAVGIGLHERSFFILGDFLYSPPKFLYVVGLLAVGISLDRIVIGWTALAILGFAIMAVYFKYFVSKKGIILHKPSFDTMKRVFKYGIFLYLPFVSVYMSNYALTLMLGMLSSPENVSFYAVSMSLVTISFLLFMPVSKMLMPTVSRIYKLNNRNSLEVLGKILPKYIGVASIFIASIFCFGSAFIIKAVYGNAYSGAVPILIILSLAIFFETFKFVTDPLLNGTEYATYVTYVEAIKLFVVITAGLLFIRQYGAIGAAWSFLAGSFVNSFCKLYMVRRKLAISLWKEAGKIFVLLVFLVVSLVLEVNYFLFLLACLAFVILTKLILASELKVMYSLIKS